LTTETVFFNAKPSIIAEHRCYRVEATLHQISRYPPTLGQVSGLKWLPGLVKILSVRNVNVKRTVRFPLLARRYSVLFILILIVRVAKSLEDRKKVRAAIQQMLRTGDAERLRVAFKVLKDVLG